MNDKLIETVIAQEKLNKICVNAFDISHPVWNIVSNIKEDKKFRNTMIEIIYANYLINNYNGEDKNKLGICNFIMNFASNKDMLYGNFIDNTGMANELVSNYYRGYSNLNCKTINDITDANIKKIVNNINPFIDNYSFNYLNSLVRFEIIQMLNIDILGNKIEHININDIIPISEKLIKRVLLADSYAYMCYNNESGVFNNYINLIENNCTDVNALWEKLSSKKFLDSLLIYFINLQLFDDSYANIYNNIENIHTNFLSTLKKINPYYLLDEIQDYNIKKYRK